MRQGHRVIIDLDRGTTTVDYWERDVDHQLSVKMTGSTSREQDDAARTSVDRMLKRLQHLTK